MRIGVSVAVTASDTPHYMNKTCRCRTDAVAHNDGENETNFLKYLARSFREPEAKQAMAVYMIIAV